MKQKLFFVLVITALVLTACGGGAATQAPVETEAPVATEAPATEAPATEPPAAEAKVATFIWTQEFDSLSPLYQGMWFSEITQQFWLCWAWQFNEKNEAFPYLLTELPSVENGGISEDGTQITMHLRDDIKWSDNEPLTSEDFKFTWEMFTDTKNTVSSAYPYDNITSIDTPDEQTVVINFEAPFSPWLANLWQGILPSHILRPVYDAEGTLDNAEWNLAPTVGCGPYVFDEWESGSFARFTTNPNYWGEPPKIDEIFVRFVPDDASQTAALVAGDADLGAFIPYSDIPQLKEAGMTLTTEPSGFNEGWFFRIDDKSHPAMHDLNVRKALAMAIDREAVNRDLLLGLTKVPASYWDSLPFYNDPPSENYPYDPEAANALLDEAGWVDSNSDGTRDKDGVELVLRYGTTTREIRQDLQAVAQQQLAEVGIGVEISNYDADLFFAGYGEGPAANGELDIMEWSDAPGFPDPDVYYWLCSEIATDENPAGSNWFFCDEELDALIQQQSTQMDANARQETISQINQMFHDNVYWVGMWQDPDVWAVGPRLTGVKFSGVTPFFNIAEWDIAE